MGISGGVGQQEEEPLAWLRGQVASGSLVLTGDLGWVSLSFCLSSLDCSRVSLHLEGAKSRCRARLGDPPWDVASLLLAGKHQTPLEA